MIPWFIWFAAGWFCGALCMWIYFIAVRMLRTRHEWYSDPVIRARYPEEAERALSKPDSW